MIKEKLRDHCRLDIASEPGDTSRARRTSK